MDQAGVVTGLGFPVELFKFSISCNVNSPSPTLLQGTYLTSTARNHAKDSNLHEGTVIGSFNGEFWWLFASNQVTCFKLVFFSFIKAFLEVQLSRYHPHDNPNIFFHNNAVHWEPHIACFIARWWSTYLPSVELSFALVVPFLLPAKGTNMDDALL